MTLSPPKLRGIWRDDDDARAVYSEAAGVHRLMPLAVAIPADVADVVALLRWAHEHRIPVTARGSGSSMPGGAVGAGIIIDLTQVELTDPIAAGSASVVVPAGAICAGIDAAARTRGLRFPVDPSSAAFCTIGGMAGTNSAGARTLRHGQTNAWVRGLHCVFADGGEGWVRRGEPLPRVSAVRRFMALAPELLAAEQARPSKHAGVRKDSSGYGLDAWSRTGDLVDLLVGSEGTLALFVAVELDLIPVPAATGSLLAAFSTIEDAAKAAALASGLGASACELLDRTFLDIARQGGPLSVPADADAVLLTELEEAGAGELVSKLQSLSVAFRRAGAVHVEEALEPAHIERLWHLRHAASPILAALSTTAISMQIIEDGAVPPAQLPAYVRGLRALLADSGFGGVLFGHAGDGHVHANVMVDVMEPDWRPRLERIFLDGTALIASLGGTVTGEHGDGRLRAPALPAVWPAESLRRFRMVKDAFDPEGILNPGVKFAASDAPTFGSAVKYDPASAALPPAAAAVLARVQRERAWGRPRLELLKEETER